MRIRRKNVVLPALVQRLKDHGHTFKDECKISGLTVRVEAYDWESLGHPDLQKREIKFWMTDGSKIGVGQIVLIRSPNGSLTSDEIYDYLEFDSNETSAIAHSLMGVYDDDRDDPYELNEFFDGCAVAYIEVVWNEPGFKGCWHDVIHTIIKRRSGRDVGCTAYVLQACPLEYRDHKDSPEAVARLAAMKRYYYRLFCVTDVVGELGDDGWMVQTFI